MRWDTGVTNILIFFGELLALRDWFISWKEGVDTYRGAHWGIGP